MTVACVSRGQRTLKLRLEVLEKQQHNKIDNRTSDSEDDSRTSGPEDVNRTSGPEDDNHTSDPEQLGQYAYHQRDVCTQ